MYCRVRKREDNLAGDTRIHGQGQHSGRTVIRSFADPQEDRI